MLALRLQRTGRKKVSNYRVIAQEHRFQPTSGKIVAYLGHYNPHTKEAELETEQIEKYLSSGARPSDAAAKLFKAQGIKLPDWVTIHEYEDKKAKAAAEEKTAKKAEAKVKNTAEDVSDEADATDSEVKADDNADEATPEPAESKESTKETTADNKADKGTDPANTEEKDKAEEDNKNADEDSAKEDSK